MRMNTQEAVLSAYIALLSRDGGEGGTPTREICRHLSSTVVYCRLETCINKVHLRFEDLGSS
jgi:hypothetical protein